MKKRLLRLLVALSMLLAMLPGPALAFEQPPTTEYWINLTRPQVVNMVARIDSKTEDRNVVLLCYPLDGQADVSVPIEQFSKYANGPTRCKIYSYAFSGGSGDPSRIDSELETLFPDGIGQWPVAVTYNISTQKCLSRDNIKTLQSPGEELNGLRDLMMENQVDYGSSGKEPYPDGSDDPDAPGEPDDPEEPSGPDIPEPPEPDLPEGMDEDAWDVLRLTNQHRMGIGAAPLSVFDTLQEVAVLRAEEIYRAYRPDHTRPDGRICWTAYQECNVLYHFSAENIASGQHNSDDVMNSWLHSPGHRRNIENPQSVHIGIGHYYGLQPNAGRDNWTQDFAAAHGCSFSGLALSADAIYGKQGAALEDLLTEANIAVTATCYRHNDCILPLIADMCSGGYDPDASEDQVLTVTYGGQTAELTIAVRHDWDEGAITVPATCTESGTMTYTCRDSGCGKTVDVAIPALQHDFSEEGNPDTCTHGCGVGLAEAMAASLDEHLVIGHDPAWTQEEAEEYARAAADELLQELHSVYDDVEIEVVEYLAPVNGTPEHPDGDYGYMLYRAVPSRRIRMLMAASEEPVLRLDIEPIPLDGQPVGVHENAFIITFDADGGQVEPSEMTAGKDGTLSVLPSPSRSRYDFMGWFTEEGDQVTSETVFEGDTTVYARWSARSGSSNTSGGSFHVKRDPSSSSSYKVTAASSAGGSVSVRPSSAGKGEKVTITVTPDSGYALSELRVTEESGKELSLSEKSSQQYTFTMPDGKVSVEAFFDPVQEEETGWRNPFSDVSESEWYYDAIQFVSEHHLMSGYGSGLFDPDANLTRAQMVQILYNKEGAPRPANNSFFIDVSVGDWFADAVAWASENRIVSGYSDGRFDPNGLITREQLTAMLWRYAGSPSAADAALSFYDAESISDYAKTAVNWAVDAGILQGNRGALSPNGLTTRAQAAQMLKNYLEQS